MAHGWILDKQDEAVPVSVWIGSSGNVARKTNGWTKFDALSCAAAGRELTPATDERRRRTD
jgi:hypothetical protein